MAVTAISGAKKDQQNNPGSPQTFSIDTDVVANRGIVVWIMSFEIPGVTAVTVGANSLTAISGASASNGNHHVEGWGGILSVTGTQTITVTFTNAPFMLYLTAIVFSGTDQLNGGANAQNAASPLSLALTSAVGDLTSTGFEAETPTTPNSNKTLFHFQLGAGNQFSADDFGDGTANPTHTWTRNVLDDWSAAVVCGVNFRANAATPTPRPSAAAADLAGVLAIRSVGTRVTIPTP